MLFLVMLHAASKVPPLLRVSVPPDTSGVEVGLHREGKRIATLYNNVVCVVGLYLLDIIAVRSDSWSIFDLRFFFFLKSLLMSVRDRHDATWVEENIEKSQTTREGDTAPR